MKQVGDARTGVEGSRFFVPHEDQEQGPPRSGPDLQDAGEERFRSAFHQAAVPLVLATPEGRHVLANQAACDFLGLGADELRALPITEVIHPEDRSRVGELWQRLIAGETDSGEVEHRFRRKDGTVVWGVTRACLIRDGAGRPPCVLVTTVDVTPSKQAEDGLRRQVERMRLITDAAPLLISYVGADLRYQFNNKAYAAWFGRPLEEIEGRQMSELLGDAAFERVRRHIEEALAGKTVTFQAEMPYVGRPPRIVHTTYVPHRGEAGRVEGFVVAVADVTDEKWAEQALRDSEARKSAILESALDCIITMDHEGRVVEFNPAAEKTFGFSRDQALGRPVVELIIPPAFRDRHVQGLAHYLATGEGPLLGQRVEVTALRADGDEFAMELAISPIHIAGHPFFTAYARDITERLAAQAEKARLLDEVQASAARQRAFLRDVLASVTDGKLRLCDTASDLPPWRPALGEAVPLSLHSGLRPLRVQAQQAAIAQGFAEERGFDLATAVSEAAMNAVVHAGGGTGRVCADRDTIQVWIEDHGGGIAVEHLPRATLEKGFTTAGTLGHGLKLTLQTINRLWLLTGPTGTTVALELDRLATPPSWS